MTFQCGRSYNGSEFYGSSTFVGSKKYTEYFAYLYNLDDYTYYLVYAQTNTQLYATVDQYQKARLSATNTTETLSSITPWIEGNDSSMFNGFPVVNKKQNVLCMALVTVANNKVTFIQKVARRVLESNDKCSQSVVVRNRMNNNDYISETIENILNQK